MSISKHKVGRVQLKDNRKYANKDYILCTQHETSIYSRAKKTNYKDNCIVTTTKIGKCTRYKESISGELISKGV